MGEARRRGTFEQRKAEAIERDGEMRIEQRKYHQEVRMKKRNFNPDLTIAAVLAMMSIMRGRNYE